MHSIRSIAIPPLTQDLERVLIDAETIQRRVAELANQINHDYADITEPLILVGILKGSFIYLADLCRKLTVPHVIDFIAVSSYGKSGSVSTGNVRLLMDTRENLENHHVLIVEDILDTGYTRSFRTAPVMRLWTSAETTGGPTLWDASCRISWRRTTTTCFAWSTSTGL